MLRHATFLLVAALFSEGVRAHHAVDALYHENRTVRVEGELAQINFRNPHSIVQLIVREKTGQEVRYAVEWAAAGVLEEQGVTSMTLKAGDFVVITGSPSRNPRDHRIRMTTLRRPKDNFTYQDGMALSK